MNMQFEPFDANTRNIGAQVMYALRQRGHSDEAIRLMAAREVFSEYCLWHGLINWSDTLWDAVSVLMKAEEQQGQFVSPTLAGNHPRKGLGFSAFHYFQEKPHECSY